ncbi:MAG: DUF86 domain-containing protein [Alphaproteobacteria bacterium]|nr:DUF86 domain-containing protein [Alphaproteobacteria bacterium]
MAGTRDHLIHGYDSVDIDLMWLAVSEQVPTLARSVGDHR